MKKLHIIALVLVAASIVAIVLLSQDYTTYETFSTAKEKSGKDVKVVGNLVLDKPIEYDPKTNANLFTFYMKDKDNEVHKVIFRGAQPQDFRRSEQLVLTGKMQGNEFYSSNILMKCPSKYVDNEIKEVKEASLMPSK
jgi:cytochrome c-type biogenesis protein CcmE